MLLQNYGQAFFAKPYGGQRRRGGQGFEDDDGNIIPFENRGILGIWGFRISEGEVK
jgi:hypothetical protein